MMKFFNSDKKEEISKNLKIKKNIENNFRYNQNLVNLTALNLRNANEEDLFVLRNRNICYIFSKNVLNFGINNFIDFIINSKFLLLNLLEFKILDKESDLYKEHIKRLNQDEFLWKYVQRGKNTLCTYLSKEGNNIYVNSSVLGDLPQEENKTGRNISAGLFR